MEGAAERKERLKALRTAAELSKTDEVNQNVHLSTSTNEIHEEKETIKFRNYVPRDDELMVNKIAPPVIPQFLDPILNKPKEVNRSENPILSIAPKQLNWDLRRDVEKKLAKLEKRTQRAMVELMIQEEKRRRVENGDVLNEDKI